MKQQQQNNSFHLPQHSYENIQLYPGLIGLTLVQAMAWCQQQQASAWTNDNQNLSGHKWQLEHTFILLSSTRPSKVCKTQPYYSIYHEIIHLHVLTAPWNIWQLTERPEARLWACMCGVNNVNLPVIYGKLRQSTLTLTDYRFSTSFDQLGIFEQGDNKSQSGEIQKLHAMCGPVPKCCRFRRSRDGNN